MDAIDDKLHSLKIGETSMTESCLLFIIPAELRVEIYELVLRKSPPVIVIDLRDEPQTQFHPDDTYALPMTCKRIYQESSKIRYQVNAVHIFAPVFVPNPNSFTVENRGLMVQRLQKLATHQARTNQLTKIKIFLGRMPMLRLTRWMDFFMRWNAVLPALRAFRECVEELKVSFEVRVQDAEAAQFQFVAGNVGDVERGMEKGTKKDGRVAKLTEKEGERLGKMRATIVRTLFAGDGSSISGREERS